MGFIGSYGDELNVVYAVIICLDLPGHGLLGLCSDRKRRLRLASFGWLADLPPASS